MQQDDSGFFPLSYSIPNTVRKFADQDIYVKKDDLSENFDILQGLLYQNFATMKRKDIELKITRDKTEEDWEKEIQKMRVNGLPEEHIPKKPYPKIPIDIKCKSKGDMKNAYTYYLTFQNDDRICFAKSGINASNGASITLKNARNLYADKEFQTQLTSAIETGNSQPLLDLLSRYSVQDRSVNNAHTRRNLYRKTQDDAYTTTYTPVQENYDMADFYKNAVDRYQSSPKARRFEIRDYKNPSTPGQIYYEYKYDPVNMCICNPYMAGRAQVYQDKYEDNSRKIMKQNYLQQNPILQYYPYYPLFDYQIRNIKFRRPSYFIDYGSFLVPVYR